MTRLRHILTPVLLVLVGLFLAGGGPLADIADAKAKIGGKSFRSAPKAPATPKAAPNTNQAQPKSTTGSSFGKGLAGGLLGGALGGLLFGSMFGMGGQGMGFLPILLLAGVGWFLYRKFTQSQRQQGYSQQGYSRQGDMNGFPNQGGGFTSATPGGAPVDAPPPMPGSPMALDAGLAEIRRNDPDFEPDYFLEVASDVFFKIQAGWMRRDLSTFRHLLGEQLAGEYADHFADMKARGVINKLESIAVRNIKVQKAGSTGTEDYVTVLFSANLLDYTVDEASGEVVEGSMTEPVKFEEEWTWARPVGTQEWRLEGIHEPE